MLLPRRVNSGVTNQRQVFILLHGSRLQILIAFINILVRSKALTSITIPYIVVHTPDLRSPSPVRVRGCRLVVARLW